MTMEGGQVIVVVGGGGAIGQSIAHIYARQGGRVALIDHDAKRLSRALATFPQAANVRTYVCDIRDEAACDQVVRRIQTELGRIDVLVHAAGLTQVSLCRSTKLDVYRRVMEVNFLGVAAMTTATLPALIATRGRIIVLSSVCGFAPLMGRSGYCASKYALHGFFETLRCEVRQDGVSVLIVCPSFVDTDFATRGLSGDGSTLPFLRSTVGRPISPDRLATMIVRAAQARRRMLFDSWRSRLSYWLTRLAPSVYERLMSSRFKAEFSRDRP